MTHEQRTPNNEKRTTKSEQRNQIVSYALIAFVLFTSSGASYLSNDKNVLIGGWIFFTALYFYIEKKIKPPFLIVLGSFVLLSTVYYTLNNAYNEVTYLGFFMKLCLAFYCRDICGENFSTYFVRTIFILTCISLVMFVLQLINFDFFFNLNKLLVTESHIRTIKSSSIVFTMVLIHAYRNCGFMWEPGAFVTVLLFTLYINLFNSGEKIWSTKNIVFLIAILTTQSTMGILGLIIPFSLQLKDFISQNRTYQQLSVVIIPAFLATAVFIFTQVDVLYKKITTEVLEIDDELTEVEKGIRDDYVVSVTRSVSVILDWKTIKRYPLLGLGVDMRTTGFKKLGYSEKLETSCGTTILLLRFGFIGFFIYAFLLYKNAIFDTALHKMGWVLLVNYALFSQEVSTSAFYHLFIF